MIVFAQSAIVHAQNLVPNPSFEEYDTCPDYFSQLYHASGWTININTGDYFNICGVPDVHIPNNVMGFQYPPDHSCTAYCGIITYAEINPGSEEIIGRNLISPLIIGQKYYVSFKVSLADVNCGINKLGIKFTNTFYGDTITIPSPLVNNFAHIYTNNVITDTSNWTQIAGSFTADSAYNYILIGRFFDYSNTTTICNDSNIKWSYYFIDDICVSSDSSFCYDYSYTCNVGITNYENNNINISPNPIYSVLHISSENIRNYSLKVYNLTGELIFQSGKLNSNTDINLSQYPKGVYFLQIITANKILNKKFIIN